jgi:hypothetical protein
MIHRMLWKKVCYALRCKLAAVVIHRTLVQGRGVLSLRCHARCCCDPQNAWWKVCLSLRCKLAVVVIHRMLWKVCYPCAAMQARCCCDPECSGGRKCAIPALPCKLAAVVIHCSGARKGAIPALSCMQAAVMIHRMLW